MSDGSLFCFLEGLLDGSQGSLASRSHHLPFGFGCGRQRSVRGSGQTQDMLLGQPTSVIEHAGRLLQPLECGSGTMVGLVQVIDESSNCSLDPVSPLPMRFLILTS